MRDETLDIYARVHNRVDEIMHYIWDPIGVAGEPGARDEYDAYVPHVVEMLFGGASADAITKYLHSIESEAMGVSPLLGVEKRTVHAAEVLVAHYQWISGPR
jgi:hypothetical protein